MILDPKTRDSIETLILKMVPQIKNKAITTDDYKKIDQIVDNITKRLVPFTQSNDFKIACWHYIKATFPGTKKFCK